MILGIFIIIISYLFFSLAFFGDKLVLSGPLNPKLYVFYVGILNIIVIFFLPFTIWHSYNLVGLFWAVLVAITTLFGLYTMFVALEKFDASRVMPTVGALQPIFILVLTWIFWGVQSITRMNFLAFTMLLVGSIAISVERKFTVTVHYLLLTVFSSLMFSLAYIFSKMVFLHVLFFPGIILMGLCISFFTLAFLFDKNLRAQVFSKKPALDKKTGALFIFTQGAGGIANLLQSLAISLVPVSYLAIINSLRGIQYVFLFIITLFFSYFLPKIMKEDISKKVIIQKTISVVLIIVGLAVLVIY
ncbi:MAG: hypothetical protein EXS48_00945 [Candidatus Staskawiczbacteria bacterium]|nr:hypothetical protein [Candidatus Staskawiczbacteria bacterium]